MNTPAWIFVIAICVVAVIALSVPHHHCVRCGKACDGRMAGGTIDEPLCWRCVNERKANL